MVTHFAIAQPSAITRTGLAMIHKGEKIVPAQGQITYTYFATLAFALTVAFSFFILRFA
jgi:hypothetical protein